MEAVVAGVEMQSVTLGGEVGVGVMFFVDGGEDGVELLFDVDGEAVEGGFDVGEEGHLDDVVGMGSLPEVSEIEEQTKLGGGKDEMRCDAMR